MFFSGVHQEVQVDTELIESFVTEAREYLDEIEPTLIELGQDSSGTVDPDIVNAIFRAFHSVKGSAGFLGFSNFERTTHKAENILDMIRTGQSSLTPHTSETLCATIDLFRDMLEKVETESTDSGFEEQSDEMVRRLEAILTEESDSENVPAVDDLDGETNAEAEAEADTNIREINDSSVYEKGTNEISSPSSTDYLITPEMGELFAREVEELLEILEESLLALQEESSASREEAVAEAFRSIHSFKGNCGIMGLVDLQNLSHQMENLLDLVKSGELKLNGDITDSLLKLTDVLKNTVSDMQQGGNGTIAGVEIYIDLLATYLPKEKSKTIQQMTKAVYRKKAPKDSASANETPKASEGSSGSNTQETPSQSSSQNNAQRAVAKRQDLRVDISKVDSLMDLIGELVIAEAMVTRNPVVKNIDDPGYERSKHQLRRITSDLQDIAMSIRMIPLESTFRKMIRLVHDVAKKSNKKIKLEIRGEETEVDKTVIEKISDPLVHIVRNACDHGVETPEKRKAAGKPEEGKVIIEGRHEDGEVWIIIKDNGAGLYRDKLIKRAIERGILTEAKAAELTDQEAYSLIFEPGFSTAEKVTDISGRGVGMDVVRKNIEKVNGKVDISSTPGEGSQFTLRIPLTMAIIDGMLVRVGTHTYTIPLLSIQESLRPQKEMITTTPDGSELVRLREEMLPILRLGEIFNQKPDSENLWDGTLVVVTDDDNREAIFVDEIVGQQQTVIKGLSSYIGNARGTSGCTILGDGTISLILETSTIIDMYQEIRERKSRVIEHST